MAPHARVVDFYNLNRLFYMLQLQLQLISQVKFIVLLYIELSNSFLIGRQRTVNFRNQRP